MTYAQKPTCAVWRDLVKGKLGLNGIETARALGARGAKIRPVAARDLTKGRTAAALRERRRNGRPEAMTVDGFETQSGSSPRTLRFKQPHRKPSQAG